jgi:hypothetical protein
MANAAWMPADILCFWGADRVSRTISWRTSSPFAPRGVRFAPSHVGIIARHPRLGWQLVESTTLSSIPCAIRGECVEGCQSHYPRQRIREYQRAGGRVELYRLAEISRLRGYEEQLLSRMLFGFFVERGIHYSVGRAMLSGTVLAHTRFLPADAHHSEFCSQLLATVLMELARLARSNPTGYCPGRLMAELIWNGTYGHVPRWDLPEDCGPRLKLYRGPEQEAA